MAKFDLSGRTPTVQRAPAFPWPRWRIPSAGAKPVLARDPRTAAPAVTPPAPQRPPPVTVPRTTVPPEKRPRKSGAASPPEQSPARPADSLLGWLLRESLALLGMAGAALTVFAQLAWVLPLSRPFMDILGAWMTLSSNFWLSHYDALGFYPHSHLQAALALAAFLAMIGLGARVSAIWSGTPLERRWGFLDGMTWPSLAIMGALAVVFLLSYDPGPSGASDGGAGGRQTVKYLFVIILMVGYAVGDLLGQKGFHTRLYRLAILLILLAGLNHWLLAAQ